MATTTIHDVGDLGIGDQSILEEARRGEARLRDAGGVDLVLMPTRRVSALRTVVGYAARLFAIEQRLARTHGKGVGHLAHDTSAWLGDWAWLAVFDENDLGEFLEEMREAFLSASRDESPTAVEETLEAWRVTAEALSDPARRDVLLGEPRIDDFVEVTRPE
jgi:hypothetical protein